MDMMAEASSRSCRVLIKQQNCDKIIARRRLIRWGLGIKMDSCAYPLEDSQKNQKNQTFKRI
eukprot:UN11963